MKKIYFILFCLSVLFGLAFYVRKNMIEALYDTTLSSLVQCDNNAIQVSTQIQKDTCFLLPCITLQNTTIRTLGHTINAGNVLIQMQPTYPLTLTIETEKTMTTPHLVFIAKSVGTKTSILHSSLNIGGFRASFIGEGDTARPSVTGVLETVNLASFILPSLPTDLQFWGQLFFTNAPQTFSIQESDGWLTMQGLPLIRLK